MKSLTGKTKTICALAFVASAAALTPRRISVTVTSIGCNNQNGHVDQFIKTDKGDAFVLDSSLFQIGKQAQCTRSFDRTLHPYLYNCEPR